MNPPVFLGAVALILAFVVYGTVFTGHAEGTFAAVQSGIVRHFGWFYVLSATLMLIFAVAIACSRLGNIRLGGDQARPEFHGMTWFTMLIAAGMGIGLVFFGVAEPIEHYIRPIDAEPRSREAIRQALFYCFFHWGLHPWAIYIAIALPLAYFHFRYGLPLAPRSLLYPLIGERYQGWPGHAVDILGTVGTLFGIGTSLGLGAMQINAGLNMIAGFSIDLTFQLFTIGLITLVATISVVTGLKVGIRRLSQFNLALAGTILGFVILGGPTVTIMEMFTSGLGTYLAQLPRAAFWVDHQTTGAWQSEWTLFYWSWWIAWSPFVGIFAARISKGRTIREFVTVMLLVPTLTGCLWFAALGGTALTIEHDSASGGIAEVMDRHGEAEEGTPLAFYALLERLPWSGLTSLIGTLVIVLFFITSSDSGSLVAVMVTSGGNENPPTTYRVFWCVTEGVVAACLLVAGGLTALRTASLTPALPMALLLLVGCFGVLRALRADAEESGRVSLDRLSGESPRDREPDDP